MRKLAPIAVAVLGLAVAAPAGHSATIGISDQQAATFTNPLYKPLKLTTARYVAPYDVMDDPAQLQRFREWFVAARAAKQRILVSFEHSRLNDTKARQAPTAGQYETATRKFKAEFPSIREINTWNEVNRCQPAGATEGQPRALCKSSGARLLNSYYKSNRKIFKGSKIIPLNVLDENNPGPALAYIRAFKRIARPVPKIWGIHNYSDTNRLSDTRTKRLIKQIGRRGDIWLLETGGQLKLGPRTFGETRAASALKCMFYIGRTQKRVKRLYIYQFNGARPSDPFDAGLVSINGAKRKGYTVVQKRQSKAC